MATKTAKKVQPTKPPARKFAAEAEGDGLESHSPRWRRSGGSSVSLASSSHA